MAIITRRTIRKTMTAMIADTTAKVKSIITIAIRIKISW